MAVSGADLHRLSTSALVVDSEETGEEADMYTYSLLESIAVGVRWGLGRALQLYRTQQRIDNERKHED